MTGLFFCNPGAGKGHGGPALGVLAVFSRPSSFASSSTAETTEGYLTPTFPTRYSRSARGDHPRKSAVDSDDDDDDDDDDLVVEQKGCFLCRWPPKRDHQDALLVQGTTHHHRLMSSKDQDFWGYFLEIDDDPIVVAI